MTIWNITVPAETAMGGVSGSGSNTSDITGVVPGDFDGATINSVTLSGAGNVTLNTGSSNDSIGVRWCIRTSGGTEVYGSVASDAASIAYCPTTVFSSLPAAIAAGGTTSPAPTTAVAADWDQVYWAWTYTVSGKNDESTADYGSFTIVVDYTPAGQKEATGDVTLPSMTASGVAKVKRAASGAATIAAMTVIGAAHVWPTVWLNSSESLTGADQQVVTAANAAGTSITFNDTGTKTGSLFIGVELPDASIDWHPVTVNSTGKEATGNVTLPALTSTGTSLAKRTSSGASNIPALTASGSVIAKQTSSGAADLPALTASGSVIAKYTSSGAADLPALTSTGSALSKRTSSGASDLPALTAAGTALSKRTSSGASDLPALTATGTSLAKRTASGAADLPSLTAAGTTSLGANEATGDVTLPSLTSSGSALSKRTSSGTADLPGLTSSGSATAKRTSSGAADLPALTAAGTTLLGNDIANGDTTLPSMTATGSALAKRTSSGAADLPSLTSSGTSLAKRTSSGASDLPALTAAGTVTRPPVADAEATGAVTLPAMTSTGAAHVWPRVWLNESESKTGADRQTVTAANSAGTSVTFNDTGNKGGSLFVGVELPDASIDWHAVFVNDVTATGTGSSLPAMTAAGSAVVNANTSQGSITLPALTATGSALAKRTSSGASDLPALTAAGSASPPSVADVQATGVTTLPALTSTGTAHVWPRVWLNESESKTGADRQTVTAANSAGTSVTFNDTGNKGGSLYVGVELVSGEIDWHAVFVNDVTATGTGSDLPSMTATGRAVVNANTANGSVTLPAMTGTGLANVYPDGLEGSPVLPALTGSGTATVKHTSSGSTDLPALTADGSASAATSIAAARAGGEVQIPTFTASGTSLVKRTSSGNAALPSLTSAGTAVTGHPASGSSNLPALVATGRAAVNGVDWVASGSVTLPAMVASGAAIGPSVEEEIRSGGWAAYNYYDAWKQREKRRKKYLESIEDEVDREIAELIHDDEEEKLSELKKIVAESFTEQDLEAARRYSERVAKAYERAYLQGNYSAYMAFEREMERAREEEEFLVLAMMLLQ